MTAPQGPSVDDKVVYEQLFNDFRSLNGFLWQTPLIFMTLTGGLWLAVASFELSQLARGWLITFAGLSNLLMILALCRRRYVMQRIISRIQQLDGRPDPRMNYFIVTCFSLLLLMAAIGSFVASSDPAAYFTKVPPPASSR